MKIANNIIKEHLKNVYFLCGGAYGGKTTIAKLLEEKHGFIRYRQGDHEDEYSLIVDPKEQPAMGLDRSSDWHGYFAQPPRKYADWMKASLQEEAEFTIADLLSIPKDKKVIVDGIIPVELLKEISDYDHVFLLFAPDDMKRKHYFDRAEQVYTAIEASPEHEQNVYKLHAQLLNNQAALDLAKKNYDSAYERLNKAMKILPQEEEDDLLLLYNSMTYVCHLAGRTDEEQHYAQLAQTLAAKLGRN